MAKKGFDPLNVQVGQDREKEISVDGKAEVTKETVIEPVEGPDLEDQVELERFMNEIVEILVYEPFEEGEQKVVQLSVGGRNQFVPRGVPTKVKRKYVEVLARAKKVTVSANGVKDPNGEARNIVRFGHGLQFPFQVLNDPNPNGPAWLRKVLAEG